MSTENPKKITFFNVGGTYIEADALIKVERIPAEVPTDDEGYKVVYTASGSAEHQTQWVSYHVYCALREVEKAK